MKWASLISKGFIFEVSSESLRRREAENMERHDAPWPRFASACARLWRHIGERLGASRFRLDQKLALRELRLVVGGAFPVPGATCTLSINQSIKYTAVAPKNIVGCVNGTEKTNEFVEGGRTVQNVSLVYYSCMYLRCFSRCWKRTCDLYNRSPATTPHCSQLLCDVACSGWFLHRSLFSLVWYCLQRGDFVRR